MVVFGSPSNFGDFTTITSYSASIFLKNKNSTFIQFIGNSSEAEATTTLKISYSYDSGVSFQSHEVVNFNVDGNLLFNTNSYANFIKVDYISVLPSSGFLGIVWSD